QMKYVYAWNVFQRSSLMFFLPIPAASHLPVYPASCRMLFAISNQFLGWNNPTALKNHGPLNSFLYQRSLHCLSSCSSSPTFVLNYVHSITMHKYEVN